MRKWILIITLGLLVLGMLLPAAAQDTVDLEALRSEALAQIEIDPTTLTDVPAGSSPEFTRDLLRNKRITAYYADLYLSDPVPMTWAGLAAYVSDEIGVQLETFQSTGLATGLPEVYAAFVEANNAVYADLYWQHHAYRTYGLPALEQAYAEGLLAENVIAGWRLIDADTPESVAEGSRLILQHEQGVVLQEVLYTPMNDFFLNLPDPSALNSPLPNHDIPFQGTNFADFEQRWAWATEELTPGWVAYQADNAEKLKAELVDMIFRSDLPELHARGVTYLCGEDAACAARAENECAAALTSACLLGEATALSQEEIFAQELQDYRRKVGEFAALYLLNPEKFLFAPLPAISTNTLSDQIEQFQLTGVAASFPDQYNSLLDAMDVAANALVPPHQLYAEGGLAALEEANASSELPDDLLAIWRKIDSDDPEIVWEGVLDMLRYEQNDLLQSALYDALIPIYPLLASTTPAPTSPVPGHAATFEGSNYAVFEERWAFWTEVIFPAYREWATNHPDEVRDTMYNLLLRSGDPDQYNLVVSHICAADATCIDTITAACTGANATLECLQTSKPQ